MIHLDSGNPPFFPVFYRIDQLGGFAQFLPSLFVSSIYLCPFRLTQTQLISQFPVFKTNLKLSCLLTQFSSRTNASVESYFYPVLCRQINIEKKQAFYAIVFTNQLFQKNDLINFLPNFLYVAVFGRKDKIITPFFPVLHLKHFAVTHTHTYTQDSLQFLT